MRGLLVTATDTEVGKTVVAAALTAALVADGHEPRAYKPAVTGLDEPVDGVLADHELLARVTGDDPALVSPQRFGPAVSPHLGAQLAGTVLDPGALVAGARAQAARSPRDLVVVEGVGGLLVPLTPTWLVRDLAVELALPVVVAARPALGTINHTLLTLAAARDAGLDVRAVILTPWPAQPSTIEASNRETLEALAGCEVAVLPRLAAFDDATLAAAGAALSPARWIGAGAAAA
ncbi:dethiobiotin synthase [Paraconexibacter algicola]|uniref:dethiobiotin synthase n=1 Tax=Paraconexibacter algicola TaxID=2133960 RepID=UPI001304F721|nr:dethiobiotin synthase [Paraconexibacter algicola]